MIVDTVVFFAVVAVTVYLLWLASDALRICEVQIERVRSHLKDAS